MELVPAVSVRDLLTVGGASVVTTVLVGIILNAWRPAPDVRDRFGPIVALVTAEIVTVGAALVTAGDLANAVLAGILVTAGSTFTHSLAQAATTPRRP